jgi:hypothetical protein
VIVQVISLAEGRRGYIEHCRQSAMKLHRLLPFILALLASPAVAEPVRSVHDGDTLTLPLDELPSPTSNMNGGIVVDYCSLL